MRRIATTLVLLALSAAPALAASQVRISQVYGGGGSTSALATYNQDYVEIFNSGATPVDLTGWTVEYGSATGNWGSSAGNIFNFPAGTIIQPCQYMLIVYGTPSTGGAPIPVTPDFTYTSLFSATSGKVALFNAVNANLACGAELPGTLVDKVSYGTGNCPETANAGTLANNSAAVRNNAGMDDTDNNSADFTVVVNPVPRNSSTFNPNCQATPTRSSTWGKVKSIYR